MLSDLITYATLAYCGSLGLLIGFDCLLRVLFEWPRRKYPD
jgi:hypothetical protein